MSASILSSERRELLAGSVALILFLVAFASSSFNRGEGLSPGAGYVLYASFQDAEGLPPRADVRMAGVSIGHVQSYGLVKPFRVRVQLWIDSDIGIPVDSAAVIETDGLLGDKYVEIQPGGSESGLRSGQEFEYTQDSVVLGDLLARILDEIRHR